LRLKDFSDVVTTNDLYRNVIPVISKTVSSTGGRVFCVGFALQSGGDSPP
jgi:hypothetical protein